MRKEISKDGRFIIEWTGRRDGIVKEIITGDDINDLVVGSVEKDRYMPFTYGSCSDRVKQDLKMAFPWCIWE